jgi:alpha-tubulin suppressor-like RCC1 family protein
LFSWGSNDSGRLGHGDESDRFTPTLVKALVGRKIISVGMGSSHTLLLEDNGTLWAYGNNKHGQLGLGSSDDKRLKPTIVSFFKGMKISSISAASDHSYAILDNGSVYSWGKGEDGQLGHGNQKNYDTPKEIDEIKNLGKKAKCASLGSWHSLILLTDGTLLSCGNSTYGQTGQENNELLLIPTPISALKGKKIIEISSGSSHNAVITDKGDIYTWGNGSYGQIGNDKKENCSKPKLVVMLINDKAKMIQCGLNHVVALMHSGKVYSWGAGTYGRLGIGDESDKFTPQIIELFEDKVVRSICAGGSNSGAVTAHQWVPDKDVKECMQCKEKYTFFNRRVSGNVNSIFFSIIVEIVVVYFVVLVLPRKLYC